VPISAAARIRYTLAAGSTAVVVGLTFMVAGLAQGSTESPSPTSADVPLAAAPSPSEKSEKSEENAEDAESKQAAAQTPTTPTPPPSATPTVKVKTATKSKKKPKTTVVEQVLAHINEARVAEGRKALTLDENLSKAAAIHNQLMIDGCGLSHQCPGESGLGERFSAQGVKWTSAGENIGYGSSGSSDAAKVNAANGLTDAMLAELPPDDGHRKNLLSRSFTRIGLSVVRDGKGVTWMTQDFVG
jgi:uncharacterized protein YkwD